MKGISAEQFVRLRPGDVIIDGTGLQWTVQETRGHLPGVLTVATMLYDGRRIDDVRISHDEAHFVITNCGSLKPEDARHVTRSLNNPWARLTYRRHDGKLVDGAVLDALLKEILGHCVEPTEDYPPEVAYQFAIARHFVGDFWVFEKSYDDLRTRVSRFERKLWLGPPESPESWRMAQSWEILGLVAQALQAMLVADSPRLTVLCRVIKRLHNLTIARVKLEAMEADQRAMALE